MELQLTEVDNYFRRQVVQGYVHDMAAAMEGGIASRSCRNFSNAMMLPNDATVFTKGNYGNKQYFSEKNIRCLQ
jgi:hypothetical protein